MPELFESLRNKEAGREFAKAFYAQVAKDPVLRPLFPGSSFRCAIEALGDFLTQFLGGPCEYSERHWLATLSGSHQRFRIGIRERDAWMACMQRAMDHLQTPAEDRAALLGFFEHSSAWLVNDGSAPRLACPMHPEIAPRWDAQLALEELITAIRFRQGAKAIAMAESEILKASFTRNRAGFVQALERMCMSGESTMIAWVNHALEHDPALISVRYSGGRTLLHGASAAGCLPVVNLLLQMGSDPNAVSVAGHSPLYCVANECSASGGGAVVRALIQAGAEVDPQGVVKECTPLHMAARRGNVGIAEALLDSGADIEARDSKGETPLRRAVNCAKPEVAALLVSRGANLHAPGSKGLTPLAAARTDRMRQALRAAT